MRYLIEFTGEHPSLPLEELKVAARACGEGFTLLERKGRLAVVETERLIDAVTRAALVRAFFLECATKLEDSGNSPEIEKRGKQIQAFISRHFSNARSYRISLRKLGGRYLEADVEKIINHLAHEIELEVSLDKPDIEAFVYLTPALHFGIKVHENDRRGFRERAVRYRPFFSPISLHPVFARVLVNLSRVKIGGSLLDPFCGTGGILLEASKIGLKSIGADLNRKMLKGAGINLKHFKQDAMLIDSDIGDIKDSLKKHGIDHVDGIATDMPYARASTTFGEDLNSLSTRAFRAFEEVLEPGGWAAIVGSDPEVIKPARDKLKLISCHRLRVHRSLSRYFMVYRKEG